MVITIEMEISTFTFAITSTYISGPMYITIGTTCTETMEMEPLRMLLWSQELKMV